MIVIVRVGAGRYFLLLRVGLFLGFRLLRLVLLMVVVLAVPVFDHGIIDDAKGRAVHFRGLKHLIALLDTRTVVTLRKTTLRQNTDSCCWCWRID